MLSDLATVAVTGLGCECSPSVASNVHRRQTLQELVAVGWCRLEEPEENSCPVQETGGGGDISPSHGHSWVKHHRPAEIYLYTLSRLTLYTPNARMHIFMNTRFSQTHKCPWVNQTTLETSSYIRAHFSDPQTVAATGCCPYLMHHEYCRGSVSLIITVLERILFSGLTLQNVIQLQKLLG